VGEGQISPAASEGRFKGEGLGLITKRGKKKILATEGKKGTIWGETAYVFRLPRQTRGGGRRARYESDFNFMQRSAKYLFSGGKRRKYKDKMVAGKGVAGNPGHPNRL